MWIFIILIVLACVGYYLYKGGVFNAPEDIKYQDDWCNTLFRQIERWDTKADKLPGEIKKVYIKTFANGWPNYQSIDTYVFLLVYDTQDFCDVKNEYRRHPSYSPEYRKSLDNFFDYFELIPPGQPFEGNWKSVAPIASVYSLKNKNNASNTAKAISRTIKDYKQNNYPNLNIEINDNLLVNKNG